MASVTVLLSVMGADPEEILCKLNISGPSVVIDQCDRNGREYFPDKNCLYVRTTERGLSRSRNAAIEEAGALGAELCIFCDNDVLYRDDYEEVIEKSFERNPDSDILVFFVERPERHKPIFDREKRLDKLHSMKVFSPEVAFRLSSLKRSHLKLDTLFGAGGKYKMGEENILLFDAMAAGLKVTYVPIRIAGTVENESTWFKGFTREFFKDRGAGYYRMSPSLFSFLTLQFALRKRKLYSGTTGFFEALSAMGQGKKEYLKEERYMIIGDITSGTGPANATAALLDRMPGNTLYLKEKDKAARAWEILCKLHKADAVVFSGHSRQNIFGMKLARIFGKPSVYIMHGAVEHENKINLVPDEGMASDERKMMELADKILAVSQTFENWLKENYREYEHKISHLTNGIERMDTYVNQLGQDSGGLHNSAEADKKIRLISVGGGMPRKRIRVICRAVEILVNKGMDVTLNVAGAPGLDTKEIDKWDFVNDPGLVTGEKMKKLYRSSRIFIQNSVFETFGLAPLEALSEGCDILISDRCGVIEVLGELREGDLIRNPEDTEEIAGKIEGLLKEGNNRRIRENMDIDGNSWNKRAEELCRILREMKK